MTRVTIMENKAPMPSNFARNRLPWIVAAAAFMVYCATLNHWVTISSLPAVSVVAGWNWSVPLHGPLFFLLTYPFRALPGDLIPLALNGFAALCAAGTLAILCRSIALLPHDRTRDQRSREHGAHGLLSHRFAWVPPVFGVLAAGLQLSFWEHAVSSTGEMLNILLFAFCILALLEYRIGHRTGWIKAFALAYGVGMATNWAMIGFLPLFAVALVWIVGQRLFERKMLLSLIGCGGAGLLLYFFMPMVSSLQNATDAGYWYSFKQQFVYQKAFLSLPRHIALLLAITSILPVLVMGIRWASSFGDTSAIGGVLSNWMFKLVHGLFLAGCIAVAFDPEFSPRTLGLGLPFLTYYYLGALAIGYYSGFFLLLGFTQPSSSRSRRRGPQSNVVLDKALGGAAVLACVAAPILLIAQNYPSIQVTNGDAVKNYARFLYQSLPKGESVVALSDNPNDIFLAKAYEDTQDAANPHIFLDTSMLNYQIYLEHLRSRHLERLPELEDLKGMPSPISQPDQSQLIRRIALREPMHYLHPSFGFYFEFSYGIPKAMVLKMELYPTDVMLPPPLEPETLEENLKRWNDILESTQSLAPWIERKHRDAVQLGQWYSERMNYWGVELQKAGRLEEAGPFFEQAATLYDKNPAAYINIEHNKKLLSGGDTDIDLSEEVNEMIDSERSWDLMIAKNGPVDAPQFRYELGRNFARGGNYRQAIIEFQRVKELNPSNFGAHLWMANIYFELGFRDKVLEILEETFALAEEKPMDSDSKIEAYRLKALSLLALNQNEEAERAFLAGLEEFPQSEILLDALFGAYYKLKRYDEAIEITTRQLTLRPKRINTLIFQSAVYIAQEDYENALPVLNEVLSIQPDNRDALMNRAIVHLKSENFEQAKRDYEQLEAQLDDAIVQIRSNEKAAEAVKEDYVQRFLQASQAFKIYFGLGEIAFHNNSRQRAVDYYEKFLANAPPGNLDIETVREKLAALKASP